MYDNIRTGFLEEIYELSYFLFTDTNFTYRGVFCLATYILFYNIKNAQPDIFTNKTIPIM